MVRKVQQNWIIAIALSVVVLGGLFWVNFQFARNNPGGNDFLAHYIGTRSLIFDGVSPYSDEVALEIQDLVFGRPAQEGEIEHRVVYPLYSTLIFSPFSIIRNYITARAAWMLFLEVSLIVMAVLALNLFVWKPKLALLGFYYLFSFFWYHSFRGLINGNAVILVALLITGTLYAVKIGNDKLAGILLAFSTIKPNLVVLLIVFILFWCLYHKRTQLILWFFGTMLILALGGMLVIPNWIQQNIWEILKYPAYNPAGTLGDVLGNWFPGIKSSLKWLISICFTLLLVFEWWIARKEEYNWFLWTACSTLVISQWIGIQTDPGNFVILFTPFVLVLAFLGQRWKEHGHAVVFVIMMVVLVGLWVLFVATLDYDYQPMQSSLLFLPFPAVVLIGLYWIRWWFIGSKPLIWNEFQ